MGTHIDYTNISIGDDIMKKIYVILSVTILICSIGMTTALAVNDRSNQLPYGVSSESSNEELYKNLLITLIFPHVQKAIDDYYNEYMNTLPGEDPWSYKILSIKTNPTYKQYSYTIDLEVYPYVGPHISVGKDHITLKIDLETVTVVKFEHLESHKLPPRYQDIIKKPLPEPVVS
jgi:hypothetical protein